MMQAAGPRPACNAPTRGYQPLALLSAYFRALARPSQGWQSLLYKAISFLFGGFNAQASMLLGLDTRFRRGRDVERC